MASGKGAALPPLVQASAGAIGASISNAIVFPLDLTTTRMQTQPIPRRSSKKPPSPYATLPKALRTILNEEGLTAFYRGLAPDTLSTLLSNLLFYYFYSLFHGIALRRRSRKLAASRTEGAKGATPPLGALRELVIGCTAGLLSKGVTMPLGNVTVRQQTAAAEKKAELKKAEANGNGTTPNDPESGRRRSTSMESDSSEDSDPGSYSSPSPSVVSTIRLLIEERGLLGLWAGFPSQAVLTLMPSITLYLFEALKRLLPRSHRANPSAGETFVTSAIASGVAATVLYPLILSKTLVQYRASQKSPTTPLPTPVGAKGRKKRPVDNTALGVLKMAWRRQGIAGITMGLQGQLLKVMVGQGVTMTVKGKLEALVIEAYKRSRGI